MKKLTAMILVFIFTLVLAGGLAFAAEYEAPKAPEPSNEPAPASTQTDEAQPTQAQPPSEEIQPAQAQPPSDEASPDQTLPEGQMQPAAPETPEK
ncbi:MAG TPA: hypothetical protein VFG19_06660 [Geobacteraceae bacterium]|nr:hypothetical protein [Geobacteraceae bacterium]